jgi:succinate-semialdehyde dehydrogenase / glutarate-semialdehyde dehydrogenase
MKSINPFNNCLIAEYGEMNTSQVNQIIDSSHDAYISWRAATFVHRAEKMYRAATLLHSKKTELARLITLEMGKRIAESEAEIEKCAWVCEFYAEHAASMLADEPIASDGRKSLAVFQPLGPVLAVMPWNYPFWQVFRFAAPALMAGNTGLLKHASNVQGCSLAIEQLFAEAGFPKNVFRSLVIGSSKVEAVIANPKVVAVTLTGSEEAGSKVASTAGKYLKKAVLELGGSDPFVVLADTNIEEAARVGVQSRMLTSGQTCISAKRFIVHEQVADQYLELIKDELAKYLPGDPLNTLTQLAPLANRGFAEDVHRQVSESLSMGARLETGGILPDDGSSFYPATLLSGVTPNMPVFKEETFGPVIAFVVVKNDIEAVEMANNCVFGLGASIWTNDLEKGEAIARSIDAGAVFINGLVKSDPRLPFGGIKRSGFGRELSHYGIKEFCNIKSVWIK